MNRRRRFVLPLLVALSALSCDKSQDLTQSLTSLDLAAPCIVTDGCMAAGDGLSLYLSMGPDMQVLAPFPVSVDVQAEHEVAAVTASFVMKGMDMGLNRYRLICDGANRWLANVTLPVCTSGRSDWIAILEVVTTGRSYVVEVPFVIDN